MFDKNAKAPANQRIKEFSWKSVINPGPLGVTCKYHLKVNVKDVIEQEVKTFLKENSNTSMKGNFFDLSFGCSDIEYKMDVKPMKRFRIFSLNPRPRSRLITSKFFFKTGLS
jgi:hypothetical protein